jgi:hypothetical protein
MARKKPRTEAKPAEPPTWHAHIGRDARGRLGFLGPEARGGAQAGSGWEPFAVVDIGRSFRIHVPSAPGAGRYGMVIEGMTRTNAEPWTAGQVHTAALHGMFGFRLV